MKLQTSAPPVAPDVVIEHNRVRLYQRIEKDLHQEHKFWLVVPRPLAQSCRNAMKVRSL